MRLCCLVFYRIKEIERRNFKMKKQVIAQKTLPFLSDMNACILMILCEVAVEHMT